MIPLHSKNYTSKEYCLAEAIYNFLKLADTASKADKSVIAEEIGMILMEAKKYDIYRTTLALAGLYLDDLQGEINRRIQGNKSFIAETLTISINDFGVETIKKAKEEGI